MIYRPEIDGLRAIAVLSVMLFHTGLPQFKNGFIGVDIFFVISGYLITSIIIEDLKENSFSLAYFYERRIRRLIPALYLLLCFCTLLSLLWMQPYDFENYGQSLFASSIFTNNILLQITSGYWDTASEFKPLLHTWSLGVEEQFYLIYPILILLFFRGMIRNIQLLLVGIILLSICSTIYFHYFGMEKANFYNLISRLWELGVGGLVALAITRKKFINVSYSIRELLSALGIILLCLSFFMLEYGHIFPDRSIAVLILGTCLIILFADSNTLVFKLLSFKYLVFIGLMSYSLYLWHMPLYVFLRINSISEPHILAYFGIFLFTFIVGFLSWKIEKCFRNPALITNKNLFYVLFPMSLFLMTLGLLINFNEGYPKRFSSLTDEKNNYISTKNYLISAGNNLKNDKLNDIYVLGDSFSSDVINMLKENSLDTNYNIVKGHYNCINPISDRDDFHSVISNSVNSHLTIISYRKFNKQSEKNCFKDLIGSLKENKVIFMVVGSKDFGYNINKYVVNNEFDAMAYPSPEVLNFNKVVKEYVGNEAYYDFLSDIYNNSQVPVFTPSGKLISEDGMHLTPFGARYLGKKLIRHLGQKKLI